MDYSYYILVIIHPVLIQNIYLSEHIKKICDKWLKGREKMEMEEMGGVLD